MKAKFLLAAGITLGLSAFAQTNSQTTLVVERGAGPMPVFRVSVVSRSVQAVNYRHRSGSTKMDFAGTDLMRSADGVAQVTANEDPSRSKQNSAAWTGRPASATSISLMFCGRFHPKAAP